MVSWPPCMHRPGSGPEAPSPWAQTGQAVWAPPSSPPWGVHAILPPTCLPGLLDSLCTVCVSGLLNWPPLGTRLTAEGQGGPSTSHTFSPHIASGPYKVAMHLMVRAPNMALTSHPSVSVTDSDKGVCAALSQAPTLLPPPKKTEPQADHNWRHTRGGRHSRGQQACKHGRFTTQSRAATVT